MASSRKRTDLIERVRYPNPLPLPPYPPKLLTIDAPAERYADPSWSSRLADSVPFPLVVDGEGGMPLDINAFPELWAVDAQGRPVDGSLPPLDSTQIHSEDAWLLNSSLATAPAPPLFTSAYLQNHQTNGASGTATPSIEALGAKDVGWLRRTEYLGADRKAKAEAAVRSARQSERAAVEVSPSAEATRIEATFAATEVSLDKIQHPTKKDLKPVESFELLPDFDTWATQFHVLKFSDAPGRHEESRQVIDPRLPLSLLRARPDPLTLRPLVSFFLPTTIPADLSPQEFDEILLADPDAFDDEDRAFFQDQAGELDESVREAAVVRREERRRRNGWSGELPQEPEEVEGEDEEEVQAKLIAFSRERAKVTTPYSHQRDYEPERQGGQEDWQRILVLNFGEREEASTSLQPIVIREREAIQEGYKEGPGMKVYYHPITQRTTLRVKRARRPDAHHADPDYWQNIALTHQELSERERLKRLHKRAEVDLIKEPLPELEESEPEEEEEDQEDQEEEEEGDAEEEVEDEDDGDQIQRKKVSQEEESDDEATPGKSSAPIANGSRRPAAVAASDEDDSGEEGRAPSPSAPISTKGPSPKHQEAEETTQKVEAHSDEDEDDDDDDDDDDDEEEDGESLDGDEELAALAEEAGGQGGVEGVEEGLGRGGRSGRRRGVVPPPTDEMDTEDD